MGSVKSDEVVSSLSLRRPAQGINQRPIDPTISNGTTRPNPPSGVHQSHEDANNYSSMEELARDVYDLKKALFVLQNYYLPNRDRFGSNRRSLPTADQGYDPRSEKFFYSEDDRTRPDDSRPDEDDYANKGWKLEIKRWKRVSNRYGSSDLYDESEKIEDIRRKEQEIRSGGYVLSVYDEYDLDGKINQTLLEIHSTPLVDLLREIITFYPGDDFDILRGKDSMDDTVTFASPYMMLFAYRKQLQESLSSDFPEDAKQHLQMLLDFLKKEHPIISAKLTEIEEGRCKKIAFNKIWLLYPPNAAVYSFKGADERQLVVYSPQLQVWSSKGPTGPNKTMKFICWEVLFEHGIFKRDFGEWIMEPFAGEKNVHNLELVPAQFVQNEQQLRERLIARGRRYFELSRVPTLQDYYGDCFPRVFKDEPVRVVVDEGTYWRRHPPRVEKSEDPSQDYGFPMDEEDLVDSEEKPLNTTFLRCFPEVGVFSLRNKEWALVKVDDLRRVEFREKAFKRLVIRDDYKRIIKAMVRASNLEKPGFSDLVSGKGRGLTILLHGPPGTGKTLTAECVAEKNECPLFTISCGDLGTKPQELETRLKEVFQLAVTWKAILLLDEADIFLQERDVHDVKRNALVSIFLRELDYFEGILFLSTNRPGEIDEAFVSRIHITLGLNTLGKDEQHKIWAIFIKDLDLTDSKKRELLTHIKENFKHDNLNGRQIRNTVRTALALAQLHDKSVAPEHLDSVMKTVREYTSYLKELNGIDAEDSAFATGRRLPRTKRSEDSD
ncbi:MAG: hypothetical protein Q9217_006030 [Psora testacea]